eukprot:Gb_28014 [translate_table: standard]
MKTLLKKLHIRSSNNSDDNPDGSGSSMGTSNMGNIVKSLGSNANVEEQALVEEYQIQLAMALSVNDDPGLVQIGDTKQISLDSRSSTENIPAEVVAYRYWNYNALNYDEKVVDGFYDLYGVVSDSTSEKMPSLVDLQGTPVSNSISWEAVLVNRTTDSDLVKLEQKALSLAIESRVGLQGLLRSGLVQKIANLVADYMGGPVGDPDQMLKCWRTTSKGLRDTLDNMVLPLGCLRVGLARHRALLFKVLSECVGIPSRLIKGRDYMGTDDGALNIIKGDDGREYIVDLMGTPGTLIPSNVMGSIAVQTQCAENECMVEEILKDCEVISPAASGSGFKSFMARSSEDERDEGIEVGSRESASEPSDLDGFCKDSQGGAGGTDTNLQGKPHYDSSSMCESTVKESKLERDELAKLQKLEKAPARPPLGHSYTHTRSPSWTGGIESPVVQRMNVKDVSQYMMDAANENPELAQKLHDVLLESGVVAPPNLFTEISPQKLQAQFTEDTNIIEERRKNLVARPRKVTSGLGPRWPHCPLPKHIKETTEEGLIAHMHEMNFLEASGDQQPLESLVCPATVSDSLTGSSEAVTSALPAKSVSMPTQKCLPSDLITHLPIAAAATAVVLTSSIVSETDPTLEVPVASAVTDTAAAVTALAAVGGRPELMDSGKEMSTGDLYVRLIDNDGKKMDMNDGALRNLEGVNIEKETGLIDIKDEIFEEKRSSDKSTGNESRSDALLYDVAEWEIHWEDINLRDRIGLGSYGEVYRGEWHGTEVAVKKFLDQDISGAALEEFRSEVRIMKRLRHPNVLLFMGAVTSAPNLSIVTEFLPRGSLYRLIHRPNIQLDKRRCLKMALDVAKGMNYLHNSTPMIVHRDLKSPNLLVDKNWVVKVCDFGLSRVKHNTFLSSKSTAGTPEWMAPEVLRNEPSNEKCDVYSFGVILWELATLQQPWDGMNPMQVVGAVGFQHRCLDIPDNMDPGVANIIKQCWEKKMSVSMQTSNRHMQNSNFECRKVHAC